jgi:hypothetical protein
MSITIIITLITIISTHSLCAVSYKTVSPQKTILINPAGDAHTIGRYIGESVERSITMHCAQKMKSYIESTSPSTSVFLSRKIGEVVPFLQTAHYANCLGVNAVISLHFYQETETRPHLSLYQYKDTSYFIKSTDQLMLYPYHQAYLLNQDKTRAFVTMVTNQLSMPCYQKLFTTHQPIAFPAKPLVGIVPIALMVEMGIKNEHDWNIYVEPLCNALINALKEIA